MYWKPLTQKGIIVNSIGEFIYEHPDMRDPFTIYTRWAWTVALPKNYPINSHEMILFCLVQIDGCLNKLPRSMLKELLAKEYDIEEQRIESFG